MSPAVVLALALLAEAPVVLEGKVREVAGGPAGAPQAILTVEPSRSVTLRGRTDAFDAELRHLSGFRVRVSGEAVPNEGDTLRVQRYEILDVGDGAVPRIGIVASLQLEGQKRLLFVDPQTGAAELLPAGWTQKMAKNVGAKIWVVMDKGAAAFRPKRWGILAGPGGAAAQEAAPE